MRATEFGYGQRIATRMALIGAPPSCKRNFLANMTPRGYISPESVFYGSEIKLGSHIFIDDRVVIYQEDNVIDGATCGPVELGDRVRVYEDTHIMVGAGGSIYIGAGTRIQRGCQIEAYKASIHIGQGVGIAAGCDFQSFDHGIAPGESIKKQPLTTKGPIIIEDEAWLGHGVIVLSGVHIGKGAVIGAGAVVTKDVPAGGVAIGVPARVVRLRSDVKIQDPLVVVADAQTSILHASASNELTLRQANIMSAEQA